MRTKRRCGLRSALILLAALPGAAAAKDKVKKERARGRRSRSWSRPPADSASQVYSFQAARILGLAARPLPLGGDAFGARADCPDSAAPSAIPAGERLIELQARSRHS